MIELALILPVLGLIIGGLVDFGFGIRDLYVITSASREGARLAASFSRTNSNATCGSPLTSLTAIHCNGSNLTVDPADSVLAVAMKGACSYLQTSRLNPDEWKVSPTIFTVNEDSVPFPIVRVAIERRPESRGCLLCVHQLFSSFKQKSLSSFALEGGCT